ncbi:Haloacid dehalogenase-like hydrolase domain-containing protein 2 [Dirofilaria immitis]|nr:Haloacid dehalogenase-like hydrolase domain-containing protein 2 [Dirofilaria immitis]
MRLQKSIDNNNSRKETISRVHQQLSQLASENLNLQDKINRQFDELSETKAQLSKYVRHNFSLDNTSDADIIRALKKENVRHSSLLEVFNIPEFARMLVCDLKPRVARLLTPCFPAYLILATFRYYDHFNDEAGLTGLFSAIHVVLKDTLVHSNDMDVLSLWLVNSWRLLNLLRQYSGENNNEWFMSNSDKQNNQRMQTFDLSPLRDQLRARVEEAFQNLLKRSIEPVLSPKIVPAIFQHESNQRMLNIGEENNERRQSMKEQSSHRALDDLIELLNLFKVYGADLVLLEQVFGQMIYWICALALNHLMFRRELCNFEKAIQIKHNVIEVQSWLSTNGLSGYRETLEPLVQASHLLQSKRMNPIWIPYAVIAILQHYAPTESFEGRRLSSDFLIKVSERLNARIRANGGTGADINILIMMGTYLTPFNSEPFAYSDFNLEALSLPACLRLQALIKMSISGRLIILIDLSGTLHVEDICIAGAAAALQRLRCNPRYAIKFVTNTTKESANRLYKRLTKLGLEITPSEIFTSLTAAKYLIERNNLRPMLFLENAALEDFIDVDIKKPNAVVVGLAPSKFNFTSLNEAFRLLLEGAKLIAIHKGRYYKQEDGLSLGPGPFVEALEYAADIKVIIFLVALCIAVTCIFLTALASIDDSLMPQQAVMIGDDVRDDVLGAINAGMRDELEIPEASRNCVENFVEAVDLIEKIL